MPEILPFLHDASEQVRLNASFAIGKIDAQVGATLPVLVTMLKSPITRDRLAAARTLDALGLIAGNSLTEVLEALGDADKNVRYCLVNVLGNLSASTPCVLDTLMHFVAFFRVRGVRGVS